VATIAFVILRGVRDSPGLPGQAVAQPVGRKAEVMAVFLAVLFLFPTIPAQIHADTDEPSTCYGASSNGRLKNGKQLPTTRKNFQTYLKKDIPFSTKTSWVRHDEPYLVDFDVKCEGLDRGR
jgi:hypothetical protein